MAYEGKQFVHQDKGAIAIIFALGLIPLIGFCGLALDLGRVYYTQAIVTGAVDAAALAAGRAGGTPANMTQQANAIFNANIPPNVSSDVSAPTIQITSNGQQVLVTATMRVPTIFLGLFGVPVLSTTAMSESVVATQGAEIALVLDNTGSMAGLDTSGVPAMSGVITATQQLINILYGGTGTTTGLPDTVPGLYISVIPFTTTVNLKNIPNVTSWLSTPGQAQIKNLNLYPNIPVGGGTTDDTVGGQWYGCIEARTPIPTLTASQMSTFGYIPYPSGTDSTDDTYQTYPFTPYLYPSTMIHKYAPGKPLNRGTTTTSINALGTPPWLGVQRGDNDWTLVKANNYVALGTLYSNPSLFFGDNYNANGTSDGNNGVGPNLGCPIPLLPLQTSQSVLLNTVNSMKATFRGGTMINIGLNAGWWTISPNWNGLWPAPSPAPSVVLPQPYGNTLKVVVVMTDGINQWYDWPVGDPGQPATTAANGNNDADYTGYGRLLEGRAGTTSFSATTTLLNNSMTNMCTTLCNEGVVIYTVLFNHGGSAGTGGNTALSNCACNGGQSFVAVTNAELLSTFQSIGKAVTKLRLTWPGQP